MDKFITGQSRYCQKCGTESRELFEVTKNTQKKDQLQYCRTCKDAYKIGLGIIKHKDKIVSS